MQVLEIMGPLHMHIHLGELARISRQGGQLRHITLASRGLTLHVSGHGCGVCMLCMSLPAALSYTLRFFLPCFGGGAPLPSFFLLPEPSALSRKSLNSSGSRRSSSRSPISSMVAASITS